MGNPLEQVKGKVKETVGTAIGDRRLEREGEHQQAKEERRDEAERLEDRAAAKRSQAAAHEIGERRNQ